MGVTIMISTPQPAGTSLISRKARAVIMDILICYADHDRTNLPAEGSCNAAPVNGRFAPMVAV